MSKNRVFVLVVVGILATAVVGRAVFQGQTKDAQEKVTGASEDRVVKTPAEWKKILTAEQYRITRLKGTERAFSGDYKKNDREGIYECVCCGKPLFETKTKFDSGTGWPSFYQPISDKTVTLHNDDTLGYRRIEVECSRCDAHLGHVFDDGPKPTGLRYCMNSVALKFVEKKADKAPAGNKADDKSEK